jgi:hypothetical protein
MAVVCTNEKKKYFKKLWYPYSENVKDRLLKYGRKKNWMFSKFINYNSKTEKGSK